MYRAAELTQQNGRRYFAVLNASSRVTDYAIPLPATSKTTGTISHMGSTAYVNATTTTTGGGTANISGGWYTLEFEIISDAATAERRDIVDSQRVMRDLKYFIESRR